MKKVLITGGAGFIGSNLAKALISKGYSVTVLDNLSEQIHGQNPDITSPLYMSIKNQVNFIKGSVLDIDLLKKIIPDHEIIVHLAAETGTGQSMYEVKKYTDVNISGTATLLDVLSSTKHSVKKMIVASSRAIYGEGRYYSEKLNQYVFPEVRKSTDLSAGYFEVSYNGDFKLALVSTTEDSQIHPTSVYGITKQVQEQLVMTVCPSIGIQPVAFRYQNVYGPGQSLSNPYTGILSIFSTRIKNNNPLNIFEDGLESRDFVYIDDVVEATIAGIENEKANNVVFNIGSGVATNVLTVAKTLIELYKSNVSINVSGNYRLGDIRHNFADIERARELLSFEPKWGFRTGISMFVEWVNNQEIQDDKYEKSIEEMKRKGLFK